jgi:hypothetical protein
MSEKQSEVDHNRILKNTVPELKNIVILEELGNCGEENDSRNFKGYGLNISI